MIAASVGWQYIQTHADKLCKIPEIKEERKKADLTVHLVTNDKKMLRNRADQLFLNPGICKLGLHVRAVPNNKLGLSMNWNPIMSPAK